MRSAATRAAAAHGRALNFEPAAWFHGQVPGAVVPGV